MGLSEKIERLNEKLFETNPLLRHVDIEHWARDSVLLKDDDLAGYLAAAQREPREPQQPRCRRRASCRTTRRHPPPSGAAPEPPRAAGTGCRTACTPR